MHSAKIISPHELFNFLVAMSLMLGLLVGCPANQDGKSSSSSKELEDCQKKADKLQTDVNNLKKTLAQALANPGTIKVDPSVLVIEGDTGSQDQQEIQEGALGKTETQSILQKNINSLQGCYERLIKRNSSFHHRSLEMTIAFFVYPSGTPKNIRVRPNYDPTLIDCIAKAIQRWDFPKFQGQPVGVEAPVTLRPKR